MGMITQTFYGRRSDDYIELPYDTSNYNSNARRNTFVLEYEKRSSGGTDGNGSQCFFRKNQKNRQFFPIALSLLAPSEAISGSLWGRPILFLILPGGLRQRG